MPLSSTQEVVVHTNTASIQTESDIALRKKGFIVTWGSLDGQAQPSGTGVLSDYNVHVRTFDALGNPVGADTIISSPSTLYQSYPDVSPLSKGRSIVTWFVQEPQLGLRTDIYARIVDKVGNPVGNEFRVNSTNTDVVVDGTVTSEQSLPNVTTLTNGNFVIAWESSELGTVGIGIRARIFDSNGKPVGKDFVVNSNADGIQILANVIALNDGGFLATWSSNESAVNPNRYDVWGRFFSASGKAKGKDFLINSDLPRDQSETVARQLTGGNIVVAWTANLSTEVDVNAPLSDGRFVAFWTSSGASGADVYARIFGKSGVPLSSEMLVNANVSGDQFELNGTLLSSGKVAVSFTTTENGTSDIHTKVLNPYSFEGTSGDDIFNGSKLNKDTLFGNDGNDILTGKGENDTLNGGDGNDILSGGKGNDRITGGNGADTMSGGRDLDKFVYFSAAEGGDTILDFASGDKIVFDAGAFGLSSAGALPKALFRKGNAALDADDRFIFTKATGELWFDADGTGEAGQVLIATLTNGYALTANDIVVNFLAV
jgi:Ca2+-binding RTX toxin-like protein